MEYNAEKKFHIIFTISGNKEKIDFFHWVLRDIDRDWPYRKVVYHPQTHRPEVKDLICKNCKGGVWSYPRFEMNQVKALAREINDMKSLPGHLKVRIKSWRRHALCLKEWQGQGAIVEE